MKNLALLIDNAKNGRPSEDASLTINFNDLKSHEITLLIEALRFKGSGPKLLNTLEAPKTDLQNLQVMNSTGQFQMVLDKTTSSELHADSEILLQRARAMVFIGDYENALSILKLLKDGPLLHESRGVILQLMGHCFLELGDFESARDSLKRSLDIALSIGNKFSELSIYLFLSKLAAFFKIQTEIDIYTQKASELIINIESLRWHLGFYRTIGFTKYASQDPLFINYLLAAKCVAQFLGDDHYISKTTLETASMALSLGKAIDLSEIQNIKTENRDLKEWYNLCTQNDPAPTLSSTKFIQSIMHSSKWQMPERVFEAQTLLDTKAYTWVYDSHLRIFIDLSQGNRVRLNSTGRVHELAHKILTLKSACPISELFEKTWELKWNPHKYEAAFKVTLGRVRKILPNVEITQYNKVVSIKNTGLVVNSISA